MRLFVALVALIAVVAQPVAARPLSSEETAAVAGRVDQFDAAIRASDYGAVISYVPPKIFETIAADNAVDVATLRDVVAKQMATIIGEATIESFAIDVDGAERRELPDGTPYLLMPTTTIVAMPSAGRVQFDTRTLAMADDGTWYLVRLDDPSQIDVLRRAYPAFAGETFPLGASRQLPAN